MECLLISHRRRQFVILFIINSCINMGIGAFESFFALHLIKNGISGIALGVILALPAFPKIIAGHLFGKLGDKFDKGYLLLASLSSLLIAGLIYLWCNVDIPVLSVLRIVQGCSLALFRPVIFSLVGSCVDEKDRAEKFGIFDISFYVCVGVAPLFGGFLYDIYSFSVIVLCSVVFSCAGLLLTVVHIDNIGRQTNEIVPGACSSGDSSTVSLYALCIFIVGRSCAISMTNTFLPVFFVVEKNISKMSTGLILSLSTLVMAVFLKFSGRAAEKYSKYFMIMSGGVLFSLSCFFIVLIDGFIPYIFLFTLIGLSGSLSQPSVSALLMSSDKKNSLCESVGIFNAFMSSGFATGPLIGAVIVKFFGLINVFLTAGLISLISLICFTIISKKQILTPNFKIGSNKRRKMVCKLE